MSRSGTHPVDQPAQAADQLLAGIEDLLEQLPDLWEQGPDAARWIPAVPAGALVDYHGSQTTAYGLYRVAGECLPCCHDIEPARYLLIPESGTANRRRLNHVRRESFTLLPVDRTGH
jgi:hypothetical protein